MRAIEFGLVLVAGLSTLAASTAVVEAASRKCDAKTYAGRWLVTAGDAICTVRIGPSGRITSTKQCFYGTTDRPITIAGQLKVDGGYPCAVGGGFKIRGAKGVLYDHYRMIAAGTEGTQIKGFLEAGKVVEGFTLTRMTGGAAR